MRKYKLICVDDELPSLQLIEYFCKRISEIEFVYGFQSAASALEFVKNNPVDIALLDIEMPDLNGLELAKNLRHEAQIIFATAHSHFAIDGFNLSVTDYLLKPFTFERFNDAIQKAIKQCNLDSYQVPTKKTIQVKSNYQVRTIEIESISYLESLNNDVIIHFESSDDIQFRGALKELENQLPNELFIRIHRSYLINVAKITSHTKTSVTLSGKELPVSKAYKVDFLNQINS